MMRSSDELLEQAARDGTIDIAEWPRVLENVLRELHNIVHNDFPLPSIPLPASLPITVDPEVVASTPPQLSSNDLEASHDIDVDLPDSEAVENEPPPNSQNSTKENDVPMENSANTRPPVPAFRVNYAFTESGGVSAEDGPNPLPPDLLSLYTSTTRILERDFAKSPPYTVQRLAEMVLYPRKHYNFLPAYLRALDRIVSVTSPVSDFPLPTLQTSSNGGFLANGDVGQVHEDGLGSDESLGGALLTPIPWLRTTSLASAAATASQRNGELHSESTETIDGPNGAGSIETVSVTVNGVPSATSLAHTSPAPTSPTLSEQSDASSSSSSGTTDAQLREQGGVTQGELLRQEQEAGVIPASQVPTRRGLLAGGALAVGRDPIAIGVANIDDATMIDNLPERDESPPHARGPEIIGMEDMGPQQGPLRPEGSGLDIEAAVGRRSPLPPVVSATDDGEDGNVDDAGKPGRDPADVEKDVARLREAMDAEKADEVHNEPGDVILADADGRDVEDAEDGDMEVTGDLNGADAVDTTGL